MPDLLTATAARFPQRPAIDLAGRTLSYRELAAAVEMTAHDLARLGLEGRDRVLLVADNGPEVIILFLAANAVGAWPVLINPRATSGEIEKIEAHCEPCLSLLVQPREQASSGELETFEALGPVRLRRRSKPRTSEHGPAGDVAALLYTSGSTAAPKGVMLSQHNLIYIGTTQKQQRGYTENDKTYCPLPLSHVGALSIFVCVLASGACIRLARAFEPEALDRAIREEGVTVIPGLPALYVKLLDWVKKSGAGFERGTVRLITSSSSPLHANVKAEVEDLFGLPLQNGYGLTEATGIFSQTRIGERRHDTSIGRALPGTSIRFVDEQGRDVEAGQEGEILVRGPNVFPGYYRNEEATKAAFTPDGWLKTGDIGFEDSNGDIFVSGRRKEVIIRSGYNIHPAELEGLLNAHPAVALSAVVAAPDGVDERVIAFAQPYPDSSADADALHAYLAERVAPYKLPDRIVMLRELPTLPVGKVDKMRLKERMLVSRRA